MIRRAHPGDLHAIVAMRCAMWDELHPDERSDGPYAVELRQYFARTMVSESAIVWLVEDAMAAVGCLTLMVHEHPPRKSGRVFRGYVTAVYVAPRARRLGHARALMNAAMDYAREHELQRVVLRTTEDARPLYHSLGFAPLEHLAIELR